MSHPETCGSCGMKIEVCPDCGGLLCAEGCPDRLEDGCVCAMEENDQTDD